MKKCKNCKGLGIVLISWFPIGMRRCPFCNGTGKETKGDKK